MKLTNLKAQGFTLIEVLLALAILAIALTALLKATGQNISNTERVKSKAISHWVGMQAVSMLQLGLIVLTPGHDSTRYTHLLDQSWYWRVKTEKTPIKRVQILHILVSANQTGPFREEVTAFRYLA